MGFLSGGIVARSRWGGLGFLSEGGRRGGRVRFVGMVCRTGLGSGIMFLRGEKMEKRPDFYLLAC